MQFIVNKIQELRVMGLIVKHNIAVRQYDKTTTFVRLYNCMNSDNENYIIMIKKSPKEHKFMILGLSYEISYYTKFKLFS